MSYSRRHPPQKPTLLIQFESGYESYHGGGGGYCDRNTRSRSSGSSYTSLDGSSVSPSPSVHNSHQPEQSECPVSIPPRDEMYLAHMSQSFDSPFSRLDSRLSGYDTVSSASGGSSLYDDPSPAYPSPPPLELHLFMERTVVTNSNSLVLPLSTQGRMANLSRMTTCRLNSMHDPIVSVLLRGQQDSRGRDRMVSTKRPLRRIRRR